MQTSMSLQVLCDSFDTFSDSIANDQQQETSPAKIDREIVIELNLIYLVAGIPH